jgi:hypothetical protein
MKSQVFTSVFVYCAVGIAFNSSNPAVAKNPLPDQLEIKTILDDRDIELYTPRFIPQSTDIVVVRKAHEPDFHEAEAFSSKELERFKTRKNLDPRWADPQVTIVALDGSVRKTIDFGWSPAPNARGNKIYYIHQLKPISGLRVLAENQKGNELYSYSIRDGRKNQLVSPTLGYIDGPMPHPSENRVAYEISDNTNGAYGGTVGLGVFDEATGTSTTVLEPAKHFKLYDLIGPTTWIQSAIVTVRQTPQQEGVWLAETYKWDILRLGNGEQAVIHAKDKPVKIYEKSLRLGSASDGNIELIDDDKILKLNIDGKIIESSPMPEARGLASPDDKLEAILTEDDSIEVKVKANSRKFSQKLHGQVQSLTWSPDSKYLAAVVTTNTRKDGMEVFDRDCLILISAPAN